MNEQNENSIVKAIQDEYKRIDERWLILHYDTLVGLVLFGFLTECIFGSALFATGHIGISLAKYVIKYMLAPFLFNSALLLTGFWAMHTPLLRQKARAYFVSLLFVGVCFVFYSVHSIYTSLYLSFTAPILLTFVYSDYVLTTVTAFLSIAAKVVSELFITWDPDKTPPLANDVAVSNFVISICVLGGFYAICLVVIRFEREKNIAGIQKEIEHYRTQRKLRIDELTQIYNRTALRGSFQSMENDTSDNSYIFTMIDIDNFKMLNDTCGHDRGDQFLQEFGGILRENCAGDALPFRFGGDEFCILFKNIPMEKVVEMCRKLQSDLKRNDANQLGFQLTASVGIARYRKDMGARQLLQNTDSALYRSKITKDSIFVYGESSQPVYEEL